MYLINWMCLVHRPSWAMGLETHIHTVSCELFYVVPLVLLQPWFGHHPPFQTAKTCRMAGQRFCFVLNTASYTTVIISVATVSLCPCPSGPPTRFPKWYVVHLFNFYCRCFIVRYMGVVRHKTLLGYRPLFISLSFSSKRAAHNALLGYRNSPCWTHYTTVQWRKFDKIGRASCRERV